MKKKRKIPDDQKQPTLRESAKEEFHRAEVIDNTKEVLKKLPTKKYKDSSADPEQNLFLKKIKKEIAKKFEED